MINESVHIDYVRAPPDWGVLLVNREVVASNHTIDVCDVLNALKGTTLESWDNYHLSEIEKKGEIPIDEAVKYELYGEQALPDKWVDDG
jgi:hypothetical protein